MPEFKLSISFFRVLAFETKVRLQLGCESAIILYVLNTFFSNSCTDFFFLLRVETDLFL